MTNVISLLARKASHTAETTAIIAAPALGNIERQQAIENALSMALFHVRHGDSQQGIHAAMTKAMRAASMLKQACTESTTSGRV